MIVAGIDPSLTSAGVAILTNGQPTHTDHHGHPGHNGANYQSRNRRSRHQARLIRDDIMRHGKPDLVIIEEHPYAIRVTASEFDRSYLWGKIYEAFDWPNIPITVIANTTAKKWITGRGNATKDNVLTAVHEYWHLPADITDDEADALALASIGAAHLGDPLPFELKDRHRNTLDAIPWPVTA